jgi:DNA-binding beta-propeller fold protein YncE
MRGYLLLAVMLAAVSAPAVAQAQEQTLSCSEDAAFAWLDFWLGSWDVLIEDELRGRNKIRKILDGCAVTEEWTSAEGSRGFSLFYFEPRARTWKQIWVTDRALGRGGIKEKALVERFPDGGVRFQGVSSLPDGRSYLDRTTLLPLGADEVRQWIETSTDGGETWQTVFDALYARNEPSAPDETRFQTGRDNQMGLTFSPDGRSAWWTAWDGKMGKAGAGRRTIYTSQWTGDGWSEPAHASFSGTFDDDDPFVSPDGQWLYFVSTRPADPDGAETGGDIWRYRLQEPNRLQRLSINSDAAEYSPVLTPSGALYFASARDGGYGQGDLYKAAPDGDGFAAPEPLGPALNHPTGEWNLWVADDEREIIFEASSRATNVSTSGDLYYSWLTRSGPATPLARLNTGSSELMPRLHADGRRLYFTRAPIGGHARVEAADWPLLRDDVRTGFAAPLLVANRSSHEVTVIDLALGEVRRRISTGEGPHLLSNVEGGRVLATGYGVFPEPHDEPVRDRPPFVENLNSRVTLIDTVTGESVMTSVLEDCARPHASWIVQERAFVVCEDEAQVLEVDLKNGASVRRFGTEQEGSHVLAFEPASRVLGVSNTDSGSVTLINIDSGGTSVVPLGRGSEGALAVDAHVWVANALDGTLSVVDPVGAREIHRTGRICGFPIAMALGGRNLVWLACFGSSELVALSRDDYAPIRRMPLVDAPLNVVVHPDRELAYVSLPRANAIEEVDLATGEVIRRIPVGIEPDGLRWAAH